MLKQVLDQELVRLKTSINCPIGFLCDSGHATIAPQDSICLLNGTVAEIVKSGFSASHCFLNLILQDTTTVIRSASAGSWIKLWKI